PLNVSHFFSAGGDDQKAYAVEYNYQVNNQQNADQAGPGQKSREGYQHLQGGVKSNNDQVTYHQPKKSGFIDDAFYMAPVIVQIQGRFDAQPPADKIRQGQGKNN